MNMNFGFISGFGLGAGLLYFLDPIAGGRRRALVRDKSVHAGHVLTKKTNVTAKDLAHRTTGMVAESRSRLSRRPVSDSVLVERVRSKLGRYVSHPHAVCVSADDGRVTLSGVIFDYEVEKLLRAVSKVKGVKEVANYFEPHQKAENHPSLQGGRRRSGERFDLFQRNRAPATNFLIGLFGVVGIGTMLVMSRSKRSLIPRIPELSITRDLEKLAA